MGAEGGQALPVSTRADEPGTSLRAAGWVAIGETATRPSGRSWSRKGRERYPSANEQIGKVRWIPRWLYDMLVIEIARVIVVRR